MKREHLGIIIFAVLALILLGTIIAIKSNTHRGDDDWVEEIEEEDPIIPQLINISVGEIFTADRLNPRMIAGPEDEYWFVAWVEITNEGYLDYNVSGHPIELRTDTRNLFSGYDPNIIMDSFPRDRNITPNETIGGWLYFAIGPDENIIELFAKDHWNVGFYGSYDLSGMEFEHRIWKTTLEMEIAECGRDGPGDERPGIFYMNISVVNKGLNATIFENWLLKLNVTGNSVRDVMFGYQPEFPYINGGQTVEFKLYFDISEGSEELPETLYSMLNWIFVDVDPALYQGLI